MGEWIVRGKDRDWCRYCGRKVWQDADGNIRCSHARGCVHYEQMSSGKNRHSQRVKELIHQLPTLNDKEVGE